MAQLSAAEHLGDLEILCRELRLPSPTSHFWILLSQASLSAHHGSQVLAAMGLSLGVHVLVSFKRGATKRANEVSQGFAQLCLKTSFRAITEET